MPVATAIYYSTVRQVNHWLQAARRLSDLDNMASGNAWHGIEHNMGLLIRKSLKKSVNEVVVLGENLKMQLNAGTDQADMKSIRKGMLQLREKYLRAEETIHFYTVAINSRTTPGLAALLRACDTLCIRSMQEILQPLGMETPYVLTYVEKGIGASILKSGLRLWDGGISPVAAIKVTLHNLYRPTAIIHETGHQVAHMLNWVEELSSALEINLRQYPGRVGEAVAAWASEMAADAFAFVHTGYAAVAALHDVICGSSASVFSYQRQDPHPISYLRVLLNIEMCRQFYGSGPWDDLEESFKTEYDIHLVSFSSKAFIEHCLPALPDIVSILLKRSYRAFGNRSLSHLIAPARVSPRELEKLEYMAGPALFTSPAWIAKEAIRILALGGYRIGIGKGDLEGLYKQQEEWLIRLGFTVELN